MAKPESRDKSWLTTYADFVTLLLTFFVLLYALTNGVNKSKFMSMIKAFQGNTGVLMNHAVIKPKYHVPRLKKHRKENWRSFKKMISKNNLKGQVHFKMVPDGVVIILGGPVTFKTYSAILRPEAAKILMPIAQALKNYSYESLKTVSIFGNTDNRPVAKGAVKFPSNWSLGAGRAISVVNFLIENSNVQPKKFKVITFGKYHPIATNDTQEGRIKNRRVKIYVQYNKKIPAKSPGKISNRTLLQPTDDTPELNAGSH